VPADQVLCPHDLLSHLGDNPAKSIPSLPVRSIQVNREQPALALGVYLGGSDAPDIGADGRPLVDDDFLVLVNGPRVSPGPESP